MGAAGRLVVNAARFIDGVTRQVGGGVRWLTLAIPLVCFGYAVARKLLAWGHNGFSELQWYLFATIYLCAAGYTLLCGQHVRVDFLWRKWSVKTRSAIDLAFLMALTPIFVYLAALYWDFWLVSARQREGPEDVLVGLERWPVKLALFVGFSLFALQCMAEALKRLAVLRGWLRGEAVFTSSELSPAGSAAQPRHGP